MGRKRAWLLLAVAFTTSTGCSTTEGTAPLGDLAIQSFDVVEQGWGDAPLTRHFGWSIRATAPQSLVCTLDADGDGKTDFTFAPCRPDAIAAPIDELPEQTYATPGRYTPVLRVSDGHRSVTATTTIFANRLDFSSRVVFPEKMAGFVSAEFTPPTHVVLTFDAGSAPTIAPSAILWGTSGTGYLIEVATAIKTGDVVTIDGAQATLEDAIENGFFGARDVSVPVEGAGCIFSDCEGVTLTKEPFPEEPVSFDDGRMGKRAPAEDTKVGLRISTLSTDDFEESLFVGLTIREFSVETGTFSVKRFVFDVEPYFQFQGVLKTKLFKWEWPTKLPPPLIGFGVVSIGPFIVVPAVRPIFRINATMNLGWTASLKVPYFVRYDGTNWNTGFESDLRGALRNALDPTGFSSGAKFEAFAGPRFEALLLGIAGPYAGLGLTFSAEIKERLGSPTDLACGILHKSCYAVAVGAEGELGVECPWIRGASKAAPGKLVAKADLAARCAPEADKNGTCPTVDAGADGTDDDSGARDGADESARSDARRPDDAEADASRDGAASDGGFDSGDVGAGSSDGGDRDGDGGAPTDAPPGTSDGGDDSGDGGDRTGSKSKGDPHLVTWDGLYYDFQGVGEFVLSSDGAAWTVQVRQRPYGTSNRVAINMAVAAKLGSDRVALYAGASPVLSINGTMMKSTGPMTLPGGMRIEPNTYGYAIASSEGDELRLFPHPEYIDIELSVVPGAGRRLFGLLGSADRDSTNDLALRDGTVLRFPVSNADLYRRFGASWRIAQTESLFDYGSGETTDTFTDLAFPYQSSSVTELGDAVYHAAESACLGALPSSPWLDACIFDVGMTGNTNLASNYARSSQTPGNVDRSGLVCDGSTGCPSALTCCNGSCVDMGRDFGNCAGCNVRCVEGSRCDASVCSGTCAASSSAVDCLVGFQATVGLYAVTADLPAVCAAEFGPSYRLADWNEVKNIEPAYLKSWCETARLLTYDSDELLLSVGGQRYWSGNRHYFIARHDHIPVAGFLVHDHVDDHLVDLGSWSTLQKRVLCHRCSPGECAIKPGTQDDPGSSCADILARGGSTGNGMYWIRRAGTVAQLSCDMVTEGGGWTQVTDWFASTLDASSMKSYLYAYGSRWYRSPATTTNWSWNHGAEVIGSYAYFDGANTTSFTCSGSAEKPNFGIGCSAGAGGTLKTLPYQTNDPASGRCTVCQDLPNAFGGAVCQNDVSIFVR